MSTRPSTTYNARTYGRKSSKRKQDVENGEEPRKRGRMSTEPEDVIDDNVEETPSTPRRAGPTLARDLSGIFESYSPKVAVSPAATPKKLAQRMLARSKTESSIESSNTSSLIDRTASLPNIPSSSPTRSPSTSPQARPPPVPVVSNTRTYAGKSRSFLVSIPASSLDPLAPEQDDDEYSTRESYASLRSRWGVDNSEDDPYPINLSPSRSDSTATPSGTPSKAKAKSKAQKEALLQAKVLMASGMMNPLKSITELRSKGESRRFLDEVGYLFEGMHSSVVIGLRRASALEIVTKLCDNEFSRKAKAAEFLSRAWDVFIEAGAGKGEDKLLDTLVAFFVALVAKDPASLRDLAQRTPSPPPSPSLGSSSTTKDASEPTMVDTLFTLLSASSDALALVSTSSGQKAKNEVELKRLGVGKKDRALISTPLLVLHALQALPPACIPQHYLPSLLTSLSHNLAPILHSSTSTSLAWTDAARTIPFETVHCALRLFDVYLLGQWGTATIETSTDADQTKQRKSNEADIDRARDEWLAEGLISLGVCAELDGGESAHNCMQVTFRVLVSLTHSDVSWSRKVLESDCALGFVLRIIVRSQSSGLGAGKVKKEENTSDVDLHSRKGRVASEGEIATHTMDTLCLALGLLTNLVQTIDETKDLLRELRIDPTCTLKKRTCIRNCTCPHPMSALDILINIYNSQAPLPIATPVEKLESSPKEADPPDPDALFLRGHLAVLFGLLIRDSATNEAHVRRMLEAPQRLVEHARDFVAFYDAFGGDEGRVAKEVVTFLEGRLEMS
ncbi:hypothetical protein H0H92_003324 [Tricholoma furcatifolium]|nr:hypothetical protein H0H92_003324 [Tricholoma furcatifolium]